MLQDVVKDKKIQINLALAGRVVSMVPAQM